jgi:hypothetical protein
MWLITGTVVNHELLRYLILIPVLCAIHYTFIVLRKIKIVFYWAPDGRGAQDQCGSCGGKPDRHDQHSFKGMGAKTAQFLLRETAKCKYFVIFYLQLVNKRPVGCMKYRTLDTRTLESKRIKTRSS